MKQLTAKTSFMEKIIPFIGLILLIIVVSILNPSFLDLSNLLNLLRQISINGLIAFGMTFIILTGGIDLSVGSILALSSAFIALMITSGVDPIIALIIGVLIGFVLGAVNGLLVTKGNMAPFIATLATMTIFRGLTLVITDGNPITNLGIVIYSNYLVRATLSVFQYQSSNNDYRVCDFAYYSSKQRLDVIHMQLVGMK